MMYVAMLRRSPDPAGFEYWVSAMGAGGSILDLIAGFLASSEYLQRFDTAEPITHTVTTDAGFGGNISPSSVTVTQGRTTSFEVTPDTGYMIDTVSGCDGGLSGTTYTTGSITQDCTVSAVFVVESGANELIEDRYLPLGDGSIIRDTVTGLEWQRCSVGQVWSADTQHCTGMASTFEIWSDAAQVTTPGGFRVPTIEELRTLVYCSNTDQIGIEKYSSSCSVAYDRPTIVQAAFPNTPVSAFWSASPYAESSDFVWIVNFYDGRASGWYGNDGGFRVRLVRGEPSSDSLSAPELVSASAVGTSTASLSWLPANIAGAGAVRYTVHLSDQANFVPNSTTATVEVVDQLFAQLTHLQPERRYYAKISVPHPEHELIWSNELSFATGSIPTALNASARFDVVDGSHVGGFEEDHLYLSDTSELEVGSILVSDAEGGILRRITAVDRSTGRVDTARATLNDVFQDLHLSSETRMATVPSTSDTGSAHLRAFSLDGGERQRREFYWPETGFRLIHDQEAILPSPKPEAPSARSALMLAQMATEPESQSRVNNRIRVTAPNWVIAEPGSTMTFDVVADIVNDAALEYQITGLEVRSVSAPSGKSAATGMRSNLLSGGSGRQQYMRIHWTPGAEHVDDKGRPYIVTLMATVRKSGCSWLCDQHSLTVEVPIHVGWNLPEDELIEMSVAVADGISLGGNVRLNFDPTLRVDHRIIGTRLQSMEMVAQGPVTFDLNTWIQATGTAEVQATHRLLRKRFVKVFSAGPVPVIMSGELIIDAELKATANAEMNINQNITLGYDLEAGLIYNRNLSNPWQTVQQAEPIYRYTFHGEAEAKANLDVRLIPDLRITFYDVATGQMKLEPYVFADMTLEGMFQYNQSLHQGNFNSSGFDAAYRFTQLDLGGGLDLNLRADLSIFDYTLAGFPSNNTDEFQVIPILDRTVVFGLPEIELAQTAGTRDDYPGALRIKADVTDRYPINPFERGSGRWEAFPRPSYLRLLPDPDGDSQVIWACLDGEETRPEAEYTLRYLGHSRLGAMVQQYEELKMPLTNCNVDRYLVLGTDGGIIRDTVTGLEWQRCSVGQTWSVGAQTCTGEPSRFTWYDAIRVTAPGGFRLPTVDELRTLVYCSHTEQIGAENDSACGYSGATHYDKPTIVQAAFPNTPVDWFWTSSPYTGPLAVYYTDPAWYVSFEDGFVGSRSGSGHGLRVRLVRGGQ